LSRFYGLTSTSAWVMFITELVGRSIIKHTMISDRK